MKRAKRASNEWYTPPEVYQAVLAFFGRIDLDPCANPEKTIPAERHLIDNGLGETWHGKVFLNPPYWPIEPWIDRALSDPLDEIILLLPSRTDTRWCQKVLRSCAICFIRDRLSFIRPGQTRDRAMFPSLFAYRGPRPEAFKAAFEQWGHVVLGEPATPQAYQLPLSISA